MRTKKAEQLNWKKSDLSSIDDERYTCKWCNHHGFSHARDCKRPRVAPTGKQIPLHEYRALQEQASKNNG